MKNKDGIELKVGQVWMSSDGFNKRTIIAFTRSNEVVTENEHGTVAQWVDHQFAFRILISDPDQPWLPLPDGYRLVTDEERAKYAKCVDMRVTVDTSRCWVTITERNYVNDSYDEGFKYAVPVDHVWAEDKRKVEVGQVYRQVDNEVYTVLAIHGKKVWCEDVADGYTWECRKQDILREDTLIERKEV